LDRCSLQSIDNNIRQVVALADEGDVFQWSEREHLYPQIPVWDDVMQMFMNKFASYIQTLVVIKFL